LRTVILLGQVTSLSRLCPEGFIMSWRIDLKSTLDSHTIVLPLLSRDFWSLFIGPGHIIVHGSAPWTQSVSWKTGFFHFRSFLIGEPKDALKLSGVHVAAPALGHT
jgi:hypothetical protein